MNESGFSIGDAIKFGWSTVTSNLGVLIVALLIVFAISMFPVFFESFVVGVVSWILSMVVSLGLMRMSLRFVDGERGELIDLFETLPLVLSYFLASIVVGIAVVVGLILLIIPGVILCVRLQFFGWAIVDRQVGPLDAISRSWEATRGAFWKLLGFWCVLVGVNILGLLALGVGLLVTAPLSLVAMAHVYRQLTRVEEAV